MQRQIGSKEVSGPVSIFSVDKDFTVQQRRPHWDCLKFFFKLISWCSSSWLFLKFSVVFSDFLSSMKLHPTKLVEIATCSGHPLSWLKVQFWEMFWSSVFCLIPITGPLSSLYIFRAVLTMLRDDSFVHCILQLSVVWFVVICIYFQRSFFVWKPANSWAWTAVSVSK